jgi:hypothetical protein
MHPEGFRDDSLDETRYFALTHIKPAEVKREPTQFDYMRQVEKHMKRFKKRR